MLQVVSFLHSSSGDRYPDDRIEYLIHRFQYHVNMSFELVWWKFRPLKLEPLKQSRCWIAKRNVNMHIDYSLDQFVYHEYVKWSDNVKRPIIRFRGFQNLCLEKFENLSPAKDRLEKFSTRNFFFEYFARKLNISSLTIANISRSPLTFPINFD